MQSEEERVVSLLLYPLLYIFYTLADWKQEERSCVSVLCFVKDFMQWFSLCVGVAFGWKHWSIYVVNSGCRCCCVLWRWCCFIVAGATILDVRCGWLIVDDPFAVQQQLLRRIPFWRSWIGPGVESEREWMRQKKTNTIYIYYTSCTIICGLVCATCNNNVTSWFFSSSSGWLDLGFICPVWSNRFSRLFRDRRHYVLCVYLCVMWCVVIFSESRERERERELKIIICNISLCGISARWDDASPMLLAYWCWLASAA